jgi:hypothetical protein
VSPILEVGQAVAVVYLMYRQNSHLAEANRIARGRTKSAEPVTRSWQQNLRHYWPLLAMGVLAFASWIPYIFFTPAKELGVT